MDARWLTQPAPVDLRAGPAALVVSLADPGLDRASWTGPTSIDVRDANGRSPAEAVRFFGRRALLRHWVSLCCGVGPEAVGIRYGADGGPLLEIADTVLFCSVAARDDRTALALAMQPVGVDLEPIQPGPIPWDVLDPAERGTVSAAAEPDRSPLFLRHWTLKEAYLKARGTGLLRDPASIAVAFDGPTVAITENRERVPALLVEQRTCRIDGENTVSALVVLEPHS